ncbi:MAG: NUDIX domain-containing protein [Eubacteriales bacterium]
MSDEKELYERLSEKQLSREEIFDGVIIHLVRDKVELPNGRRATREVALHGGAVCVVPVTDDNDIIMERQFRYPFDKVIWEIPAGKLDKGETDPIAAAARELREETGYTAEKFEYIGEYYSSPAILSEKIYMYVATGLKKGERELDEDEFLDVVKIPFAKAVDMIMNDEIPDGKTQTAVLKAARLLFHKER